MPSALKLSGYVPTYPERAPYPLLTNLVQGYFHQDYDILSEDPDEIIRIYKGREWPAIRLGLIADIELFLKEHGGTDEELTQSFRKTFRPEVDFARLRDGSTKESLLKIVEILTDDAVPGKSLRSDEWGQR